MEIKIATTDQFQGVNTLTDMTQLNRINQIEDPKAKAEAAATQFENIFMGMVVKAMRDTVPEGGLFGKGLGGEHYVQMLDDLYVQNGAMPKDTGMHQALVNQIMRSPDCVNQAMSKLSDTVASKKDAPAAIVPVKG
jgi:Rod binding domain-containing protein